VDRHAVRTDTDAAEWAALLARVKTPHMVQSWAYGEAKQAAGAQGTRRRVDAGGWRTRRLVFETDGEPLAICQVLDKSIGGIRVASRVNRGPLFVGDPGDDLVAGVYGELRRRRRPRSVLSIAPALTADSGNHRLLAGLGFRPRDKRGWLSSRVMLPGDEERLRASFAPTWRNRLKAAERSGLEVEVTQSPEAVEWLIDRHIENMKEKGFSHPSPAFVRALHGLAPDDHIVFRARLDGELVGGMMIYMFGGGAEYFIGWMGAAGRPVNVGNFLYWHMLCELQRRGAAWCDLGGQRHRSTSQFKRGLRGDVYELLNEWLAF
jgi:hypothetical protein